MVELSSVERTFYNVLRNDLRQVRTGCTSSVVHGICMHMHACTHTCTRDVLLVAACWLQMRTGQICLYTLMHSHADTHTHMHTCSCRHVNIQYIHAQTHARMGVHAFTPVH